MNSILNRGFVAPFIKFFFASGMIDTVPPRYFASFKQNRTVTSACSFTLTLTYVPGNFEEDTASVIHNMLLSSVNKPVQYQYGYKTANGGITLQNKAYTGMFTEYKEEINDGYLTYTISGVAQAVDMTTPQVSVANFMKVKQKYTRIQPSSLVEELVTGWSGIAQETGICTFFYKYEKVIKKEDEEIDPDIIKIEDGPLHDIFFGKINSDGSSYPNGFVNYSYKQLDQEEALASGLITQQMIDKADRYRKANAGSSSSMSEEVHKAGQAAVNALNLILKMPFVCFYDNAVDAIGSTDRGTFYYVPKYTQQVSNIFNYNFGNNFIDSDVLNFNATYSGAVGMAVVGSLQNTTSDIDVDGESITSNYNAMYSDGFVQQTYSTASGFDESAFLSMTTIANALIFPFTATMTVIGQVDCNTLMDRIRVNVFVNGVEHIVLSGDYVITEIEDELSESGFTTTFSLVRAVANEAAEATAEYKNSYGDKTKAWQNQQALAKELYNNK